MDVSAFILILFISSVLTGGLAVYVWVKRKVFETPSLSGLLLSLATWCFASGLEMASSTLELKLVFTAISYLGITTLPVWFIQFVVEYSGKPIQLLKKLNILIWVIPVITLILSITNRYHGLFYTQSSLEFANGIPYQSISRGLWWWIHFFYSYLLIGMGIVILIRMWFAGSARQRRTLNVLFASIFFPVLSNLLYLSGLRPLGFIDLTPVAFAITGLLFFWGMYSRNLFGVKPIALKTLFDNLPDGIVVLDNKNLIVDINQAASTILSLSLGLNEKSYLDSVLPKELPDDLELNKVNRIDIGEKSIEVVRSEIRDDNNKKLGFLLIIKDITTRKKTEEKLRSATDRFELASLAAGFDPWENNLITGERFGGVKIYMDLGYSEEEIPKDVNGIFDIIHPDDIDNVKQKLEEHFEGRTRVYNCDFRIRDKMGKYRWVANYARLVERDDLGRPLRFIGLTQNIDDRKRVEERIRKKNDELEMANAEKDKFFSIIAHDLKGPFQGFIGLTELMSERVGQMPVEQIQEISQTLQVTAKNLYELLDNLLNWALIKRGHKHFNPEKLIVYPLVQVVIDIVKSQADSKNQSLSVELDNDIKVIADKESLKSILRNLLSNAIKFTPRDGSILITSKSVEKGFVEISVKDNGIGMPYEIRENLFQLSKGISRPGTEKEPSTGLGLILCKELAEKQGGRIWVESQEGIGSTFTFTLPTGY